MKRGFAAQLDHGIRANDRWYQDIEKVKCCEEIMWRYGVINSGPKNGATTQRKTEE
jgi:hypothetical protein